MIDKNKNIIAKKINIRDESFYAICFIMIALILTISINQSIFKLFIQILPFIIFISLFFICMRSRKKKEGPESQSIMQKRIKRFN